MNAVSRVKDYAYPKIAKILAFMRVFLEKKLQLIPDYVTFAGLKSGAFELCDCSYSLFWKFKSLDRRSSGALIPDRGDQDPCAHWRVPMDLMRSGWSISLFQASQQ